MSNILAFPNSGKAPEIREVLFDEAQIRAYVERYARHAPQRVAALRTNLQLANKVAAGLHELIESIKLELECS